MLRYLWILETIVETIAHVFPLVVPARRYESVCKLGLDLPGRRATMNLARRRAVRAVGGPRDRVGDVLTTPLGGAVVRDPHVHTQARERLSWSPRHVCLTERWRMKDSWSSHADEG